MALPILLRIKQCVNKNRENREKNREKNREGDFTRMKDAKMSGDRVNYGAGEDSVDSGLRGEGVE